MHYAADAMVFLQKFVIFADACKGLWRNLQSMQDCLAVLYLQVYIKQRIVQSDIAVLAVAYSLTEQHVAHSRFSIYQSKRPL